MSITLFHYEVMEAQYYANGHYIHTFGGGGVNAQTKHT